MRLEGNVKHHFPRPNLDLVSSINNSLAFPLRLLSMNRKLNDLNRDSIEVWLLRIMKLNALEVVLEEHERK
jgi:hypothetical protein